ncbi:MAG: TIM barrel protein [Candidatus Firestonebacteria bacterium]
MTKNKITVNFGINGAFLTRRWENPENFMKLTAECGYKYHEFCSDALDPFFSGDKKYQLETAKQIGCFAKKYGVAITDYYTGVATHRFHGLSHSNPVVQKQMMQWIVEAMDIALALGTTAIGGHWDAFSVEILHSQKHKRKAFKNIYTQFKQLAILAKNKGMSAIYNEQMYIPSEIPWTIDEACEFLFEVNRNNNGVPVYLTVDVGHQAGQHYGLKGRNISYIEWLKEFAAVSEIIHLQQTTADASHHWPFIEKYNKKGHIKIDKILSAIEYSHKNYHKSILAKHLPPVKKHFLIAEIIPGSTKTEKILLEELKKTSLYLKRFIPVNGLYI